MFKQYNFENNVRDNCTLKAVPLMVLPVSSFFQNSLGKKTHYYYSLFKRLIYEIQNNVHQLTTYMSTLIMWLNRFSVNENEVVEAYMPRHRDSETKKPRHRDSKTKKPQHRDLGTKTPRHRETERNKERHRDSKAFFQRTKTYGIEMPRLKNHNIEIPRSKSYDIEFQRNPDPYAA